MLSSPSTTEENSEEVKYLGIILNKKTHLKPLKEFNERPQSKAGWNPAVHMRRYNWGNVNPTKQSHGEHARSNLSPHFAEKGGQESLLTTDGG